MDRRRGPRSYTDQSISGSSALPTPSTPTRRDSAPPISSAPRCCSRGRGGELFTAAATAAKLTPTSTAADVKKGLYALKGETLDGIAPPLTFTKGKPAFPTCYFKGKLANGSFQSDGDTKPVCLDSATAGAIGKALAG